jgi:hypothetical protein
MATVSPDSSGTSNGGEPLCGCLYDGRSSCWLPLQRPSPVSPLGALPRLLWGRLPSQWHSTPCSLENELGDAGGRYRGIVAGKKRHVELRRVGTESRPGERRLAWSGFGGTKRQVLGFSLRHIPPRLAPKTMRMDGSCVSVPSSCPGGMSVGGGILDTIRRRHSI